MIKSLLIACLLFASPLCQGQFPFGDPPKETPDTLYFPYEDGIQLIVINHFDTWNRSVSYMESTQPRGLSWASMMGPPPKNIYIFRDNDGAIIKSYHSTEAHLGGLKNTTYINTGEFSLFTISDYTELNGHLRFYGIGDKIGLVNLRGEEMIPAIYDDIRKYQDSNNKRDKLIIIKDNKFGFLDADLRVLFPPIYRAMEDTNYVGYPEHNIIDGDNIKVYKENKCGLISEQGEILIDFKFNEIRSIHDSLYIGLIYRNQDELTHSIKGHWNWGYQVKTCVVFDRDFEVLTKLEDFEYIYYYGIKRFIVKKNGQFGVLNHLGEVVIPLEYDILSQENGVYHVRKNNQCGVISLEGETLIPLEYQQIQFYGQAIYVTKEGLIGVYSDQFVLIADPQFNHKHWDMGKYILTRKDGSKGFVQHSKEESYYQSPEGEVIKL